MGLGIPFYKIEWIDADGTTHNITHAISWNSKRALQAKSTMADITLKHPSPDSNNPLFFTSSGELKIAVDDTIKIYLSDSPTTSSDMILSASITEIKETKDETGPVIVLNCVDKTVLLLSRAVVGQWTDTAPEIIKKIVKFATQGANREFRIDPSDVASTKSDGSAFSSISYSVLYKPAYEAILEVSQIGNTGDDRAYIFWVDENDVFHWKYPSQSGSTDLAEGQADIYKIDLSKNVHDVVNMIIFNCGKDKNGYAILDYVFDASTDSPELRMRYEDFSEIANKRMQEPGYTWDGLTWSTATNSQVRDHAKKLGKDMANAIMSGTKNPRWKGTIQLAGTTDYTPGDLIKLTSTSLGIKNQLLRVHDVIHNIGSDGWTTTLDIMEDEKAIS